MPQVVILSLFLGLVTGMQTVALRVGPAVKWVRIELGGHEAARLTGEPWTAKIDFGTALLPRELVAIAYDGAGKELARASQLTNLSPPPAELDIIIHAEGQRPAEAELAGRHRIHKHAEAATLLLDGKELKLSRTFRAKLPPLEPKRTHVLSAEMRFEDGLVARRDLVLEGEFSRDTANELSAVLVSLTGSEPSSLEGCFSHGSTELRASAIEKTDALVIMVKDPDSRDLLARLLIDGNRREFNLGADTTERTLWPVARPFNAPGEPVAIAFPQSNDRGGSGSRGTATVSWLLTLGLSPKPSANEPRQYADAVAVAGMNARERGQRRAVVLLLGKKADSEPLRGQGRAPLSRRSRRTAAGLVAGRTPPRSRGVVGSGRGCVDRARTHGRIGAAGEAARTATHRLAGGRSTVGTPRANRGTLRTHACRAPSVTRGLSADDADGHSADCARNPSALSNSPV